MQIERALEGLGMVGARMYAVSETLKNAVNERHRLLKPALSGVLRNEIPTPLPSTAKRTREMRRPLRAACVGVLEPRKNQHFLLDVFKQIAAEQAQLYLYGTGPDEQLLQERVQRENMIDRVHFMGWVPSESIWPNIDLLLMPSLHEGAPNAVLEALGHGLPVLASDIIEHAELLPTEYLCLLGNGNIAHWKEKISFFTNEQLYDRLRKRVLEQAVTTDKLKFDWDEEFVKHIIVC